MVFHKALANAIHAVFVLEAMSVTVGLSNLGSSMCIFCGHWSE